MENADSGKRWGLRGTPPAEAIHVERVVDAFTRGDVIGMVRHAAHPFCAASPSQSTTSVGAEWQQIGFDYLCAVGALVRPLGRGAWVDEGVLRALDPSAQTDSCFGWLPITWDHPVSAHALPENTSPLGSFWVDRTTDDGVPSLPRLLVLMAGSVIGKHRLQVGRDMGLRIVIHDHGDHVRIHGVTLSGLSDDRSLRAAPATRRQDKGDIYGLVRSIKGEIGRAIECDGYVWISDLEKTLAPGAPPSRLSARGYALRWNQRVSPAPTPGERGVGGAKGGRRPRARAYDFHVELDIDPRSGKVAVVQIHRDEYVGSRVRANQWTSVRAFVMDPASQGPAKSLSSRRPTLDDEALDCFRDAVELDLPADRGLRFGNEGELFETRSASDGDVDRLGGSTVSRTRGRVVDVRPAPRSRTPDSKRTVIRSDEQASIETHVRASDLFARLLGYGIDPHAYFRFARLPLVQRARPAMTWAPDGELPNAEVRPFLGDADVDKRPPKVSDRLQLLVKYGSADGMHRRKLPMFDTAAPRLKAQYLSVACDPRWAWHEFGHVLNFASTGELEFPFAHSAGDALAAIASDPLSELAAEDPDAPMRFVTFPWIEVPGRSHGRSAADGYGWCGCRNLARLDPSPMPERYHHSYYGEQLMSSSLFRLYRAIGGDTRGHAGDSRIRLEASDYCIFLIMRAISLLGPDTLAPARTADQFLSALIDADLGSGDWTVRAIWPFNQSPRILRRKGGRIHKVARWAFERQGLYATADPRAAAEGPGQPPTVDIYIADQRPPSGPGTTPDGGYTPVPLRTTKEELWHAHSDSLLRRGRKLTVRVSSRGARPAKRITLRAWWAEAGPSGEPGVWRELVTAGRQAASFSASLPSHAPLDGVWLFASADADADPSNLALGAKPPTRMRELLELVANDNNLALAWR